MSTKIDQSTRWDVLQGCCISFHPIIYSRCCVTWFPSLNQHCQLMTLHVCFLLRTLYLCISRSHQSCSPTHTEQQPLLSCGKTAYWLFHYYTIHMFVQAWTLKQELCIFIFLNKSNIIKNDWTLSDCAGECPAVFAVAAIYYLHTRAPSCAPRSIILCTFAQNSEMHRSQAGNAWPSVLKWQQYKCKF